MPVLEDFILGAFEELEDVEDNVTSTDEAFINDDPSDEEDTESLSSDFECKNSTGMNSPIYEGAQITLAISMLLITTFAMRHSLTSEGITELLQLLILHCKLSNCLPKTLYAFRQFFKDVQHPLKYHNHCSYCLLGIATPQIITCQNPQCRKSLQEEGSVSGFIEIPVFSQIQSLFNRPGFKESIQSKSKRVKKNESAIEDIYDGRIYKDLINRGILLNEFDITLTLNTDGANPFRSSKTSLWPVYLMINELPFTERIRPENMIVAGIWYGTKKPKMAGFLRPSMTSLKRLENGVKLNIGDSEVNFRAILVASTCDLPARACVCAMNQYNGSSSCIKCKQTGKVVKVGKGSTRVFPPDMENLVGPARSNESVCEDASAAIEIQSPVNGIKGPSWFSYLKYYSFVHSTAIDYMHGVLLGVTKTLHSLWFSPKYSTHGFSISTQIDIVNKRLLQIKPPNYMSRLPRSLSESNYWKASEWKHWLLYFAPAVLYGVLLPIYYDNLLLFSEAIFLLLQDSITSEDVSKCKVMLARFVAMFPVMYTETKMTLNLHQVLHLPDQVLDLGPLWSVSCFPFEDANGFLLQLFNGTQHIDKQIAHAIAVIQKIPELMMAMEKNTPARELYNRMKRKNWKHKGSLIEAGVYLVGATQLVNDLTDAFNCAINDKIYGKIGKVISFKRAKIMGDVFHSQSYTRVRLRNSYTVSFEEDNSVLYGFIEIFCQVCTKCHCEGTCSCTPFHFAMIRHLPVTENHQGVSYLKKINHTHKEKIIAVPLNKIRRKCVFVDVIDSDLKLVCILPNILEKD